MLHLIYGGSGSGKSSLAETMLAQSGPPGATRIYIATMSPGDAEAKGRILRHQAERAHKGFQTIERYADLQSLTVPSGSFALLECLGNLVANEMFSSERAGVNTEAAVLRGLEHIERHAAEILVVSNDVFADGVEYPDETRAYCDTLASLHRALAARAQTVIETVCGIPIVHKQEGGCR